MAPTCYAEIIEPEVDFDVEPERMFAESSDDYCDLQTIGEDDDFDPDFDGDVEYDDYEREDGALGDYDY